MTGAIFGHCPELPGEVREIFAALCLDVANLHAKWQLYLDLYSTRESTDVLSDLAQGAFQLIEETLRCDMTMTICRLCDPRQSLGKDNLSIATLVGRLGNVPGLGGQYRGFLSECIPVQNLRNKQVAHNDLNTKLNPKDNPLPGIARSQIERILKLAAQILNRVLQNFADKELGFQPFMIGSGQDLIHWLKVARQYQADQIKRLTQGLA